MCIAPNIYNESENVIKYEIMDGAPQKGEIIPLRLFLGGFELGPTFQGTTNTDTFMIDKLNVYIIRCK